MYLHKICANAPIGAFMLYVAYRKIDHHDHVNPCPNIFDDCDHHFNVKINCANFEEEDNQKNQSEQQHQNDQNTKGTTQTNSTMATEEIIVQEPMDMEIIKENVDVKNDNACLQQNQDQQYDYYDTAQNNMRSEQNDFGANQEEDQRMVNVNVGDVLNHANVIFYQG